MARVYGVFGVSIDVSVLYVFRSENGIRVEFREEVQEGKDRVLDVHTKRRCHYYNQIRMSC